MGRLGGVGGVFGGGGRRLNLIFSSPSGPSLQRRRSDPGATYRSRSEVAEVRQRRDALEHVRHLLEGAGVPAAALKGIEKRVKAEVDEAVAAARAQPPPDNSALWENVYADPAHVRLRGVDGALHAPTVHRV